MRLLLKGSLKFFSFTVGVPTQKQGYHQLYGGMSKIPLCMSSIYGELCVLPINISKFFFVKYTEIQSERLKMEDKDGSYTTTLLMVATP